MNETVGQRLAREQQERDAEFQAGLADIRARAVQRQAEDKERQTAEHKAQREADAQRREEAERAMKEAAFAAYPGTRASFEADWSAIRARLMAEQAGRQRHEINDFYQRAV